MEALGTATAAATVLEQCIKLLERIRDAVERQRNLPTLIEKYTEEVVQCKNVAKLIESEDALNTPRIAEGVGRLRATGESLQTQLAKMAVIRGPIAGFFRELVQGNRGQGMLENTMRDLNAISQHLTLCIQVANIGLTRGIDRNVSASVATLEAMSKLVAEGLGPGHPLKMAQLIQGRPQNPDGTVSLTEDDVAFLATDLCSPQTSKVIKNNKAARQALQVNTPIGVDVWKDFNVVIEGNKATDGATQWNYPVASTDVFVTVMKSMTAGRSHV